MTTYMRHSLITKMPDEFWSELDVARMAAISVCEIAGNYSRREIAEAIAEAWYPVMYKYGLLYDLPDFMPVSQGDHPVA